jgi:hypothetical protein
MKHSNAAQLMSLLLLPPLYPLPLLLPLLQPCRPRRHLQLYAPA